MLKWEAVVSVPQWHSRLARRTYRQYEKCEGREFDPPLGNCCFTFFFFFFIKKAQQLLPDFISTKVSFFQLLINFFVGSLRIPHIRAHVIIICHTALLQYYFAFTVFQPYLAPITHAHWYSPHAIFSEAQESGHAWRKRLVVSRKKGESLLLFLFCECVACRRVQRLVL